MSGFLLWYMKFTLVFGICGAFMLVINKYLMKKTTFVIRYFAMKNIPVMCFLLLAVDHFFNKVTFSLENATIKTGVLSVDTDFVNPLMIKCLFGIWILGVCIRLFQYCFQYICFRRRYRKKNFEESALLNKQLADCLGNLGVTSNIKIYYCRNASTPFTFGIFRQNIIIPSHMSENLSPVILHEVMHCIHQDMLMKTGNELLKIAQWFHPFAYFYTRELEKLCELACDERVSKLLTFEERKRYAYEIINNARNYPYSVFSATFSSADYYQERLYHLLYPVNACGKRGRGFLIFVTVLILGIGLFSLHGFHNSSIPELIQNSIFIEESQEKIIKVNYLPGQEEREYFYEEYIDGFWWRGTLFARPDKKVVGNGKLTEITFSGEIYKCEE